MIESPEKLLHKPGDDIDICALCEDAVDLETRTKYGSNSFCHKTCKSNMNRQGERTKADKKLKQWWDKMTKGERVDWFQRNRCHAKNKRKVFDNMNYQERHGKQKYKKDDMIIEWMHFDRFKEEEEKCGRGGNIEDVKTAWASQLADRNAKTRKIGEQIYLGKFLGFRETIGGKSFNEQNWVREKTMADRTACDETAELATAWEIEAKRNEKESQAAYVSGMISCLAPQIDEAEIHPGPQSIAVPLVELQMEIRRAIIVESREASVLQDLEEQDAFEAEQSTRAERDASALRSGAGRPRKSEAMLLSEASRMLREKAMSINHAADRAKNSLQQVLDGREQNLAVLPADLKVVKSRCEKEINAATAKIESIGKDLIGMDIETVVKSEDADSSQIRKSISEKCKEVYKTHLPAINKSASAFRKALVVAAKKGAKANKGKKGDKGLAPTIDVLKEAQGKSGVRTAILEYLKENQDFEKSDMAVLTRQCVLDLKAASWLMTDDGLKDLRTAPGFGAHDKWMSRLLLKGEAGVHVFSQYKPALNKILSGFLEKHVPCIKAKAGLAADAAALKDQLFGAQHFAGLPGMLYTGVVPYGLSELRVLTWGCYVAFGMPMADVAGATLREKLATISTPSGGTEFVGQCVNNGGKGWASVQSAVGSALFVPGGHIVAFLGNSTFMLPPIGDDDWDVSDAEEQFRGIRIATMCTDIKKHVDVAASTTKALMACFPELAGTEYKMWSSNLDGIAKLLASGPPVGQ